MKKIAVALLGLIGLVTGCHLQHPAMKDMPPTESMCYQLKHELVNNRNLLAPGPNPLIDTPTQQAERYKKYLKYQCKRVLGEVPHSK